MQYADKETIERTAERIRGLVKPEMSEQDLFWMRFEVGERYLMRMPIPYETYEELLRDKQYWNWVQSIWYMNDLRICKIFYENEQITREKYEEIQEDMFRKYKINRVILASARPPAVANASKNDSK